MTCIEIIYPCALSQTCDTLPERFYPYLLQFLVCHWQRWKLEWYRLGGVIVESMARRSLVVFTSTVLVLLLTGFGVFGKYTFNLLANFGPLIASLTAAGICWRTARQTMGTERAWRLGMATGMGGWFAATAFWTIHQNIFHTQLSSPSLADIGFFSLPISALFALACVAREPRSKRRHVRVVLLLDYVAVI